MSIFLKATRDRIRFQTSVGSLSTEQLWDLNLNQLDTLAVSLEKAYENSKGKSFLDRKSKKDKGIKLQFDVCLAILEYKKAAEGKAATAADTRAHNQKILSLIQSKKEQELQELSVEELEDMLKK